MPSGLTYFADDGITSPALAFVFAAAYLGQQLEMLRDDEVLRFVLDNADQVRIVGMLFNLLGNLVRQILISLFHLSELDVCLF